MPWWRKPFTLIVVPHDGSNTRSVTVNGVGIAFICLVFATLIGFSAFFLSGFTPEQSSSDTKELKQKLAQLREQNRRYKKLHGAVDSLRQKLRKTHELQNSILKLSGFSEDQIHSSTLNLSELASGEGTTTKAKLSRTKRSIQDQINSNKQLKKIKKFVKNRNKVFRHTPMLWPVEGWLSSSYGYRKDPMGGQGKSFHEGVDLAAWYESPVRAPAAGTVVFSGRKVGYGKVVKIRHEYGYTTLYGHLAERTVQDGEKVRKGTLIGRVGSSGHSTGSHLHYEVRVNDRAVNPWPYLVQHYDAYKSAKEVK